MQTNVWFNVIPIFIRCDRGRKRYAEIKRIKVKMCIKGWKYYNHAMIPEAPPNQSVNNSPIESGQIWQKVRGGGTPLLARWTSNWDCGYETNWWYIIKDMPLDISQLKAKRRYEINKGMKFFEVKQISPKEYVEELYQVQVAAFSAYPEKYRPHVEMNSFAQEVECWNDTIVFAAFYKGSNQLVGYARLKKLDELWLEFNVLKTNPAFEKYAVNAAIVAKILIFFDDFLRKGGIICDGSRSINHETHFQDYLEKYFDFRKAFCHLHIRYNPKIVRKISILYRMKKVFMKLDNIGVVHQVNAVLKMEEIVRSQK